MNGLGMWLPASMPQAVFLNISPLLNVKYLVVGLGYLTLIFETIFLFTFFRKSWRIPLLIIGIGLHIGILVCFPIPFFALGVSGIYLLMMPVGYWNKIFDRTRNSEKRLKFFYDGECPICSRTRIILNHLDSGTKIEFLTVQENAFKELALKDIKMDILLEDIHSVDLHGKVHTGLDSYIRVFNVIWYLKPIAWILQIPGIYHCGKIVYKYIALNRTTLRCNEDNCGYVIPELPAEDGKLKLLANFTLKDLKVRLAFFGIIFLIMLQVLVTYNSPTLKIVREKIKISNLGIVKISEKFASVSADFSKIFFGITRHAVFMDSHFKDYNHSIAVVYIDPKGKEQWLPIFDKNGTPGSYISGPLWVKWTFRVNSPLVNQDRLANGIRDFTAFWAHKNNVNIKDATFLIRVKKNREPQKWEYDFLRKQLQNPWLDGGSVKWIDSVYTPEIKDIEKL
jgi:predicted DCC family thiol-disulfide oxidoreductase YuxK